VTADRDAVEWLRMMAAHSPLAGSTRATIGRVADEMEQLRAEVEALRAALVAGHRLAA
jgi:hypothetical protein